MSYQLGDKVLTPHHIGIVDAVVDNHQFHVTYANSHGGRWYPADKLRMTDQDDDKRIKSAYKPGDKVKADGNLTVGDKVKADGNPAVGEIEKVVVFSDAAYYYVAFSDAGRNGWYVKSMLEQVDEEDDGRDAGDDDSDLPWFGDDSEHPDHCHCYKSHHHHHHDRQPDEEASDDYRRGFLDGRKSLHTYIDSAKEEAYARGFAEGRTEASSVSKRYSVDELVSALMRCGWMEKHDKKIREEGYELGVNDRDESKYEQTEGGTLCVRGYVFTC